METGRSARKIDGALSNKWQRVETKNARGKYLATLRDMMKRAEAPKYAWNCVKERESLWVSVKTRLCRWKREKAHETAQKLVGAEEYA